MSVLALQALRKQYGSVVAVQSSDLTINAGEFVSFLGPSGCGKTTTLRMIAGLETPSSGQIILGDRDITALPTHKRRMGMVFQSYALFPTMTVAENIGFGLRVTQTRRDVVAKRVEEMLALIGMAGYAQRYPHQLSGGQQQRVALARALANQPAMLLLDEPLSALDAQIRDSLRREIRDIQQRLGITTIYVTHDQNEAMTLSDRIVVMRDGSIEQIGTPLEIYRTPANPFVATFVGQVNLFEATVIDRERVNYAGIECTVASPLQAAIDQRVACYVRPEAVEVSTIGTIGLEAQVTRVEYSGLTTQVMLSHQGKAWLSTAITAPEHGLLHPGMLVRMRFAPNRVGVWQE